MSNTKRGLAATAIAAVLLLGMAPSAVAQPLSGPPVVSPVERPDWGPSHPVLCSDQLDLCVHAPSLGQSSPLAPMLAELQYASRAAGQVLRWPAPLEDGLRGGNSGFDVYLDGSAPDRCESLGDVPLDLEVVDRTSAFALVSPQPGCVRAACLTQAWVRAGLFGLDAGANDSLATATAAYLAWLVSPCEPALAGAVDDYQANPQSAISSPAHRRGAALFPWFLQSSYGLPSSVDLLHALWTHSVQRTPPGHARFVNRPDFFDVLRSFQKDRGGTLGDLLLEYAIARAFVGDRNNGLHLPDSSWLGGAGRVRFDARFSYSSLPQWVRPLAPVEPTGAVYVWVDTAAAPAGAGLGFRAEWETPAVFRFAVIKLGADGNELGRLSPITQEKATSLDVNIEDFSGAQALLIVGANAGASAGELKFDPDEMPYEPQGLLLTVVAQP